MVEPVISTVESVISTDANVVPILMEVLISVPMFIFVACTLTVSLKAF